MTALIISAIGLGLIGSLHCLGMCGPIALLINQHQSKPLAGGVLYSLGRAVTYAGMGFILGLVGQGLDLGNFQRTTSILAGILLILFVIIGWTSAKRYLHKAPGWLSRNSRSWMTTALKNKKSSFFIGLLNGLLPCGLVYVALSTAFLSGTALWGAFLMFVFGLGTLPAMTLAPWLVGRLTMEKRARINKILPYFTLLIGVLLILRGADLGIPFISPVLSETGSCH